MCRFPTFFTTATWPQYVPVSIMATSPFVGLSVFMIAFFCLNENNPNGRPGTFERAYRTQFVAKLVFSKIFIL